MTLYPELWDAGLLTHLLAYVWLTLISVVSNSPGTHQWRSGMNRVLGYATLGIENRLHSGGRGRA